MANDAKIDRRRMIALGAAATAGAFVPAPVLALNDTQARALITRTVDDVNKAIASGKSGSALYADFERIFVKYGDVPIIARSALGVAARSASSAQMSAFTKAFQGYLARKYGKRFREFIGARFEVVGARPVKTFYEVKSTAIFRGQAPFEVLWHVSDKSGQDRFFNLVIEGVNMLASERTEIGAMLDRRRGDLNAMIEDLKKAG
ncbi:MlaC/ttg2D family ABC transporter substrate-binding protein [Pseudothioclava nitratireducens]|jgi:phospholipid transport system substrate-binding protein|uniref:MlaC/ttg2D family ABC transporter substrate-binding protein n=1 Tax=Pseudothioclava nitratireducens TaxID=1928646 RepID=UPI0023DC8ECE|nr:ABC transporter substrate-binding protein [Defluviimonas nitratireducens]MDF1620283.1 ABC transporter substrate-binding protein [Defluviimonas nitratireducens]